MADLVWSDPDPEKEDFAISPRFVHVTIRILGSQVEAHAAGLDTHSDQALFTSFLTKIRCRISFAPTSFAWRVTHHYLISTFPLCGRLPTIAIGAVIRRASWRSVQGVRCISTSSRQHRKMSEMGQINKQPKRLLGR